MAFVPIIYDWRPHLCPVGQLFVPSGDSVSGGLTLGGAAQSIPEPGGRGYLTLDFPAFYSSAARSRDISWTLAQLRNGAVFRIALYPSFQLVPRGEIFGAPAEFMRARSYAPPFHDPTGASAQVWDPKLPVAVAASEGDITVVINMNGLAPVLDVGHLIGFRVGDSEVTHAIMDIAYAGEEATITINPPLRRSLTTARFCYLRPSMLATCLNADQAAGEQVARRAQGLSRLQFAEALI